MTKKYLALTFLLCLALWVFWPVSPTFAAACTSIASGNWTSPATWTSCGGGYPGQTINSDTATIAAGHTVTLNANPANPISRLTVNSTGAFNGGTSTLTLSGSGGTPGLSVAGSFFGQNGTTVFNNSVGATTQTLVVNGVGLIEFNHLTVNNVTLNSTGTRVINVLGNISLNNGVFTQTATRQFVMRGNSIQTFAMTGASTATLGRLRVNQNSTVILPNVGTTQPTAQDVTVNGSLQQTATSVTVLTRFLRLRNVANTADTFLGVDLTPVSNLGSTTVVVEGEESLTCTSSGGTSTPYAGRCFFITPTNTGVQTVVTLWALTLKEDVTFPLPAVFRWDGLNWLELTNRSSGNMGDYTYATGTTSAFSPFLIADSGNAPTAVSLQSLATVAPTQLFVLIMLLLFTGMTGALIWRSRRHMG